VAAAFDREPDATMEAVRDEVVGFEMPGATMPDYARNAMTIAMAGIYDLRLHHDEVVMPVLRFWKVFDRTDLGPRGQAARDELAAFLRGLDEQAARFVARRAEAAAKRAARLAGGAGSAGSR
jgi:acyl-[acyl-carrier-protein] desaturase